MVWLVPFVSPDSENSRFLEQQGWLITRPDGEPAVRRWWNGFSTILDLTHPDAVSWLRARLHALSSRRRRRRFQVRRRRPQPLPQRRRQRLGRRPGGRPVRGLGEAGGGIRFNEFRACWKMGGQPLAQRLHDKPQTWGAGGLASLIPEGIVQGLIGHPFNCPDMIGGGDLASFADDAQIDQELFVRYAQCAALFPMMQFSLSPARVLDERPPRRGQGGRAAAREPAGRSYGGWSSTPPTPATRSSGRSRSTIPATNPSMINSCSARTFCVLRSSRQGPRADRSCSPRVAGAAGPVSSQSGPAEVTVDVSLDTIPYWRRAPD